MKWLSLVTLVTSCLRACVTAQELAEQITLKLDDPPYAGHPGSPINIAVIGAGAAGASTAYHLRKYATEFSIPINITVFERKPYIGGRSTTVFAYDDPAYPAELGASVFVEVNRILKNAVEEFQLSTSSFRGATSDIPGAALAVWNGRELVVSQQSTSGWWDLAKLLWRYGLAPVRTVRLMKSVVGKFLKMYDEPFFPFRSLTQVAQELNLLNVTAATGEQYLADNGIGDRFAHEIVQASTRVNYAQNLPFIHGLETMVCMAAENAVSVVGGNWQIFAHMVNASGATALLETEVMKLEEQSNGSYILSYRNTSKGHESRSSQKAESQLFDDIILATPLQFSNITISPKLAHPPDEVPYVKLHVTLFTSPHLLSAEYFKLPAGSAAPRVILTTLPDDEQPKKGPAGVGSPEFFSLSILQTVINPSTKQQEYLYKMFSASAPSTDLLSELLSVNPVIPPDEERNRITWLYRKEWHSYPYEFPRVTFERIRLDNNSYEDQRPHSRDLETDHKLARGLWYTSGIESFISTMETSALMGANAARLIIDEWEAQEYHNKPANICPYHVI